jgi:hypothetical protein
MSNDAPRQKKFIASRVAANLRWSSARQGAAQTQ